MRARLALTLFVLAVPYAAITVADRVQQRRRQAEKSVLPLRRAAVRAARRPEAEAGMSRPAVSRDLWFGLGCALAIEFGLAIVCFGIARAVGVM